MVILLSWFQLLCYNMNEKLHTRGVRKYFSNTVSPSTPLPSSLPSCMYRPTACLFSCRVERTAILSTLRGVLRHVVPRDATYRRCWLGHNFSTSPLPFTSFLLYYQGSLFLSFPSPPLPHTVLIVLRSGVTQSAVGLSYCRLMHVLRGVGRLFLSNICPEGKEGCAGVLERQGLKMWKYSTPNRWRSVMRHCLISLTK